MPAQRHFSASIGVVVPAHQAAAFLDACLDGLAAAGFETGAIIVVDDGSRDATGDIARARGVRVLRNETAEGPARARNRGTEATEAELVLFVDADVVLHADMRGRIEAAFAEDEGLVAVFGSYDTAPPAPSALSRYRNLLHHYVHQNARREAATFWTGLGAVRRDAFLAAGGLDRAWQDIEDVELGVRLRRAGGRIRLDPELLGTHLKHWTLRSMLRTDLRGRAIPWTRLILFEGGPTDDLNLTLAHRASAGSVALAVAALIVSPFAPMALWLMVLAATVFVAANAPFLRFLWRQGGPGLVLAALPGHAAHYAVAILGYAWVVCVEWPRRRGLPPPPPAQG